MVYDAAGKAFDKEVKLLCLCYLGDSEVERCAIGGDVKCFKFPQAFAEKRDVFQFFCDEDKFALPIKMSEQR